jgi:hypothetical protein
MPKSSLDRDGQERLERVLELAKGNIAGIKNAVSEALKGVGGEGRVVYLRNELTRRAKRRIKDAGKPPTQVFAEMHHERLLADARAHAEATRAGWDDHHKP